MAQMDFFRRPQLVGNTLEYQAYPTVRGDVRRHDPDLDYPYAYFPGVTASETLNITTQGGAVSAALPGPGLTEILSTLNTSLGVNGLAFDAGGCIGLRSKDSKGFIQVTGGTAAAELGFDLTANSYKSVGGETAVSPEGRAGNIFGTAFPTYGENWTTECINRALSRISSNTDVLYSEHCREEAVLQKVTGATVVLDEGGARTWITLPTTTRAFVNSGVWSNTTSKEELAAHFLLIDPTTKLPFSSKVVAVTRGTPSGIPPYANAANFAGTGNVLGQNLAKATATAITNIKNGRVVYLGAVLTDVVAGDIAEISGATNTYPWSNNGKRWVVEDVNSSAGTVTLRPMSKSELDSYGVTGLSESHPVVDLNDYKGISDSYGNIAIYTGHFCTQVSLKVDPPLPPALYSTPGNSFTPEVWVSQPRSLHTSWSADSAQALATVDRGIASDYRPMDDDILSGFSASIAVGSGRFDIEEGTVRWKGQIYRVPRFELATTGLTDDTYLIYWNPTTGAIAYGLKSSFAPTMLLPNYNVSSGAATQGNSRLLYEVVRSGGLFTSFKSLRRFGEESSKAYTVGRAGQFATLKEAIDYINVWSAPTSHTQPEIILLEDQTVTEAMTISVPSLLIRGANSGTTLTVTTLTSSDNLFTVTSTCKLIFEDLTIQATSLTLDSLVKLQASSCRVIFTRVTCIVIVLNYGLVKSSYATNSVTVRECNLYLDTCLHGVDTCGDVIIEGSDIRCQATGAGSRQILKTSTGSGTTALSRITISKNMFYNWSTNSATDPLLGKFNGASVIIDRCGFSFTTAYNNASAILFQTTQASTIVQFTYNRFLSEFPIVYNSSSDSHFSGNILKACTPSGLAFITAKKIQNNRILMNSDTSTVQGLALAPTECAIGNLVEGYAEKGIRGSAGVTIQSNKITLSFGSSVYAGLRGIDNGEFICDNYVNVSRTTPDNTGDGSAVGIFCNTSGSSTNSATVVNGNVIFVTNAEAIRTDTGISYFRIADNYCYTNDAPTNFTGLVTLNAGPGDFKDNFLYVNATSSKVIPLDIPSSDLIHVRGNCLYGKERAFRSPNYLRASFNYFSSTGITRQTFQGNFTNNYVGSGYFEVTGPTYCVGNLFNNSAVHLLPGNSTDEMYFQSNTFIGTPGLDTTDSVGKGYLVLIANSFISSSDLNLGQGRSVKAHSNSFNGRVSVSDGYFRSSEFNRGIYHVGSSAVSLVFTDCLFKEYPGSPNKSINMANTDSNSRVEFRNCKVTGGDVYISPFYGNVLCSDCVFWTVNSTTIVGASDVNIHTSEISNVLICRGGYRLTVKNSHCTKIDTSETSDISPTEVVIQGTRLDNQNTQIRAYVTLRVLDSQIYNLEVPNVGTKDFPSIDFATASAADVDIKNNYFRFAYSETSLINVYAEGGCGCLHIENNDTYSGIQVLGRNGVAFNDVIISGNRFFHFSGWYATNDSPLTEAVLDRPPTAGIRFTQDSTGGGIFTVDSLIISNNTFYAAWMVIGDDNPYQKQPTLSYFVPPSCILLGSWIAQDSYDGTGALNVTRLIVSNNTFFIPGNSGGSLGHINSRFGSFIDFPGAKVFLVNIIGNIFKNEYSDVGYHALQWRATNTSSDRLIVTSGNLLANGSATVILPTEFTKGGHITEIIPDPWPGPPAYKLDWWPYSSI